MTTKIWFRNIPAVFLCMMMVFQAGTGTVTGAVREREREEGQARTYIVQADTEKKIEALDQRYGEGETVSELGENSMKDAGFTTLELTAHQAKVLENDKGVALVEPDLMVQASSENDQTETTVQKRAGDEEEWNLQAIRCDGTKDEGDKKKKVKVALIDSGVDLFNDIDVKESINLIPGEENVLPLFWDISGHGTSIAGILAAKDNGEGITGINPDIELYSARVLDENKSAPVSRIIEAIYWAIEKKVNIISLSFGTTVRSEGLETAIRKAAEEGILIVAAAGNHGVVEYPAAMEEVMAVGGTDPDGTVCDYSARGDEVEIVAPAEQIKTTGSFDGVVICNGTSMAVPHVVGVASRLWEKDLTKSADFIRQLMDTAANQCEEETACGNGLVDYEQALQIYNEFEKSYISERSVEQNGKNVEENNSAIPEFTDVDYVNGSWLSNPTSNDKNTHKTIADNALEKNGYSLSQPTNANLISAVKLGAVYPDQKNQGTRGMTDHPCLHGYFKTTTGQTTCNYVSNYIECTKFAVNLRQGVRYSNPKTYNANNANQEFQKLFANMSIGSLDAVSGYRAAFAYGVAIHTATDVFAHSVWTKQYGRLFHEVDKSKGKTNNYADNSAIVKTRFEAAKDVAVNILAHYKNNTVGTAEDFCKSSNYKGDFLLYNFYTCLEKAGSKALAEKMKNYSKSA